MSNQSSLAINLSQCPVPCKPFVKWVGGKRQLLATLNHRMPTSFDTYFEPFLGGGALFFNLQPKQAVLFDINDELINTYIVIRDNVKALIADLKKHQNTPEYFYAVRSQDRTDAFLKLSRIERASRFIFLNKTAFNGLWRVNANGQHNVPFGKYKNPNICDEVNLLACSETLKGVKELRTESFLGVEQIASKNDFVYFDPPYHPLTETANFTSYAKEGFSGDSQLLLKQLIDRLTAKGVKVMLSNSSASLIVELYGKNYNLQYVDANRSINCKAVGRGPVKEVLVTNY